MKKTRMQRQLKKRPLFMVLACYVGYATALLLWHAFLWAGDAAAYGNGKLAERQLTAADFDLSGMVEQDSGALLTTDADPQMIWRGEEAVDDMVLRLSFSRVPEETVVFAKKTREEDYSLAGQVFGQRQTDGSVLYDFPAGTRCFRIDPDIYAGNEIRIQEITINRRRPFYTYFLLSGKEVFWAILTPGLLASVRAACGENAAQWRKRGKD